MATAEFSSVRFSYRKRELPPIDQLVSEARRIYAYNEDAKGLLWKEHKNPKRPWPPLGSIAGGDDGHGYLMCLVLGHKFKVHQVVWMINYGEFPNKSIDHINGDAKDNRIDNLRLAEDVQNSQNLKTSKREFAGIKKYQNRKGFSAVVQYLGKKHYFGYFATMEEAHAAYLEGKRMLCGDFSPV